MDHVAILRKARISKDDNLLGDILAGTKTVESRWYVNKISPWNKVKDGDRIYFKESGCPVAAAANVSKVLQFENLDENTIAHIVRKYWKRIAPHSSEKDFLAWVKKSNKRYCILIFLENVKAVEPFYINKKGFGISSAWLAVGRIESCRY